MEQHGHPIATVDAIDSIEARGPWSTKSGGKLHVLFAMSLATTQNRFLQYDETALAGMPSDIRGLRVYTVRDLPNGRIGGTEWHRVREEMVFVLEGSVRWTCEDLAGGKREFSLTTGIGIWMPPFILHTYEVTEEGSGLLIIANTLFLPDDPRTHDTYSAEAFRDLHAHRIPNPK